jgi:hypothetical protein
VYVAQKYMLVEYNTDHKTSGFVGDVLLTVERPLTKPEVFVR